MSLHKRGFGFGFGFGGRGADGKKGLPLALKREGHADAYAVCIRTWVGSVSELRLRGGGD